MNACHMPKSPLTSYYSTSKMSEAKDIPADGDHEVTAEQLADHVICVCEKRQLKILTAIGAILIVIVATVGGIVGTRASSSSSREGPSAAPTVSSVPNRTAPLAVPVAASPTTDVPTHLPPSQYLPTSSPFNPVPTPDPIQNVDPMPTTTPPTGIPVVSSPIVFSPTMDSIRNDRGMLRCGFYDYTVTGDDSESYDGFSIDLVR